MCHLLSNSIFILFLVQKFVRDLQVTISKDILIPELYLHTLTCEGHATFLDERMDALGRRWHITIKFELRWNIASTFLQMVRSPKVEVHNFIW